MAEADAMVAAGEAARAVILAEAMSRGETGSGRDGVDAGAVGAAARADDPCRRRPRQIVAVAQAFAVSGNAAGQGCRAVGGAAGAHGRGGRLRGRQAAPAAGARGRARRCSRG